MPAGRKDELGRALAEQYWNPASGRPINQESMAYVILTFSYVGLRGLDSLGAHPTDAEREAYVHAWSVIGHVMGVRDELLARNFDDAKFLFDTIKRRRRGASKDGAALTGALLQWMEDAVPAGLQGAAEGNARAPAWARRTRSCSACSSTRSSTSTKASGRASFTSSSISPTI